MTSATRLVDEPDSSSPEKSSTRAEPELPGRVDISDRVVAKIAAIAAGEVVETGGVPRRILGKAVGSASEDKNPSVRVKVDGSLVYVSASIAVRYPASIRKVCDEVAEQVRERVRGLCGLRVARVELEVPALLPSERPRPRVA